MSDAAAIVQDFERHRPRQSRVVALNTRPFRRADERLDQVRSEMGARRQTVSRRRAAVQPRRRLFVRRDPFQKAMSARLAGQEDSTSCRRAASPSQAPSRKAGRASGASSSAAWSTRPRVATAGSSWRVSGPAAAVEFPQQPQLGDFPIACDSVCRHIEDGGRSSTLRPAKYRSSTTCSFRDRQRQARRAHLPGPGWLRSVAARPRAPRQTARAAIRLPPDRATAARRVHQHPAHDLAATA